jgi:hypothetical protein
MMATTKKKPFGGKKASPFQSGGKPRKRVMPNQTKKKGGK